MHTDISAPVLKLCAQKTSRITGRSYPRAGGNHIGATLEFPFKTRLGGVFDHTLNPTITERSQTLHSSRASHKHTPELGKNQAARNRVKLAQASLGA